MAVMHPEALPEGARSEPKLAAERKVFRALRDDVDDDVHAFYDVSWMAHGRGGGVREGQADFVLVHPDRAVVVLEVKGGRVEKRDGRWLSTDRDGECFKIKDPFLQGRRNVKALLGKLAEIPGWQHRKVHHANAAALPDSRIPGGLADAEAPRLMILGIEDMQELDARVGEILQATFDGEMGAPGHEGLRLLKDLLCPTWECPRLLCDELAETESRIARLSDGQLGVLRQLQRVRRAAVAGCAGSGKTLLAVEKARRLAAEGFETALLCYNRNLGAHLRRELGGSGVSFVGTFHSFCAHHVAAVRGDPDWIKAADVERGEFWERELPELALDAGDQLEVRYDAVVVDEGQDFLEAYWLIAEAYLREPEDSILYVFHDDNQLLRGPGLALPDGLVPFDLVENWRNTRSIHDYSRNFHRSPIEPKSVGPPGSPVEFQPVSNDEQMREALRKTLHRLANEESVPLQDIVVLTPRSHQRSAIPPGTSLGNLRLTEALRPGPGEVTVSTIHSFKGLERPLVILAEVHELRDHDREAALYVGTTRARSHLVVLAERSSLG